MPLITLRTSLGVSSPNDLTVEIKDNTLEYLRTATVSKIRVSAYFDRDCAEVLPMYAELYIDDECKFESKIVSLAPGSRTRKNIQLPGPMQTGEQLTLEVKRTSLEPVAPEAPASEIPAENNDE